MNLCPWPRVAHTVISDCRVQLDRSSNALSCGGISIGVNEIGLAKDTNMGKLD